MTTPKTSTSKDSPKPDLKLSAALSPALAILTLSTGIVAWAVATGQLPSPIFALLLAATCVTWLAAMCYLCVKSVIRAVNARTDRWGKRIMAEVRENRIQIIQGGSPDGRIRAVK